MVLPSVPSANSCAFCSVVLGGHDRAHDLDQRQHRHRVEEVQADHALGVPGLGAELHDRHRRRVRGEELGVGRARRRARGTARASRPRPRRPPRSRRPSRRARRARSRTRCARPRPRDRPRRACPSARRDRASGRSPAFARSRRSPSSSTTVTSTPERAQTSAIPLPMSPPPTTPTRMAGTLAGLRRPTGTRRPARRRRSSAASPSRAEPSARRRARRPTRRAICAAASRSASREASCVSVPFASMKITLYTLFMFGRGSDNI